MPASVSQKPAALARLSARALAVAGMLAVLAACSAAPPRNDNRTGAPHPAAARPAQGMAATQRAKPLRAKRALPAPAELSTTEKETLFQEFADRQAGLALQ